MAGQSGCWRSRTTSCCSSCGSRSPSSPSSRSSRSCSPGATPGHCSASTWGCCAGPGGSATTPDSALGTDRYPPFSLGQEPGYPATLDIAYPERLSRGLVLVKWWLLAIPQYAVVTVFAGGAAYTSTGTSGDAWQADALSGGLIGLLVFFAAITLLVAAVAFPSASAAIPGND